MLSAEARRWAEQPFDDFVFEVGRRDIQKFAHAIGETDAVHFDAEAARAAGHADIVAPFYFPYVIRMHASHVIARDELAPDGSATADVPPVPATRAMAGETSIEMGSPIVAGDVITLSKRVTGLDEKEGRSGTLVFVTMEFTFTNQVGQRVARESFTRIYR